MLNTGLQTVAIDALKQHPNNPRKITNKQLTQLERSIINNPELLQARPIICTPEGYILAGNQRHKVLQKLKHSQVFICVIDVSEDRQKEMMVVDNVNNGEWDWDILMKDWSLPELEAWGVEIPKFVMAKVRKKTKEDNFNANPDAVLDPKSKPGDIYEFVSDNCRHYLFVGDSTSPDTFKSVELEKCQCVFTDPPYNVNYAGRGKKTSNTILNDNMDRKAFLEFLTKSFEMMTKLCKPSASYYICHSSSSQREFEDAMNHNGLVVKNQIIWVKTIASMGWGDYRWMHEPLFYATIQKKDVQFYGDRKQYTVWKEEWTPEQAEIEIKKISEKLMKGQSSVWQISRETVYQHPTQKPLQLIEIALHNSTKEGDHVLDLFAGSGSTLIACEQLGRNCITSELDCRYADVVLMRYIAWKETNQENFTILKNGVELDTTKYWV